MAKKGLMLRVRMGDEQKADLEYMAGVLGIGASEVVRSFLPSRAVFDAIVNGESAPSPRCLPVGADSWLRRLMWLQLLYESPKAIWMQVQLMPDKVCELYETWCRAMVADKQREDHRTGKVVSEVDPDCAVYGFQAVPGTGQYVVYGPNDTQEDRDCIAERIWRLQNGGKDAPDGE